MNDLSPCYALHAVYSQSITKPFTTYKIIQPISSIRNLLEYDSSQDYSHRIFKIEVSGGKVSS